MIGNSPVFRTGTICAIVLLILSTTSAAQNEKRNVVKYTISLDKHGEVIGAKPDHQSNPFIEEFFDNWLRSLKYEPATVDGEAVESTTGVWVEFFIEETQDGITLEIGDYNVGPLLKRGEQPVYPRGFYGTDGSATVEFTIRENGKVFDPRVLHATHDAFAKSFVKALRSWHFRPNTAAGEPIEVRVVQTMHFKMHEDE